MPDFIEMTQAEMTEAIRKWTIHKQRRKKKKKKFSHVYRVTTCTERLLMAASFLRSLRFFRSISGIARSVCVMAI
jgi:hypothetical protein